MDGEILSLETAEKLKKIDDLKSWIERAIDDVDKSLITLRKEYKKNQSSWLKEKIIEFKTAKKIYIDIQNKLLEKKEGQKSEKIEKN